MHNTICNPHRNDLLNVIAQAYALKQTFPILAEGEKWTE